MGVSNDVIEEPDSIRKIDDEDEFPMSGDYSEAKLTNLDNIKGKTDLFFTKKYRKKIWGKNC